MYIVIILVGIVFLFSIVAVFVAIGYTIKNKKRNTMLPEAKIPATITYLRTETVNYNNSNFSSQTVDSYNTSSSNRCIAEFVLENGQKLSFTVRRNIFVNMRMQDTGILTYRGNNFISFERIPDMNINTRTPENIISKRESGYGKTALFYGEAPDLNFQIDSNKPISLDYKQVCDFLLKLEGQAIKDSFFVLEMDDVVLQFSISHDSIMADIPVANANGSYQQTVSSYT